MCIRDSYTVDAKRGWANAVAIRENRIMLVGSDDEALELRGKNTRVVDLAGRMMLPGFHDSHVHPIEAGMGYLGCSLHEGRSAKEYVRLLTNCAQQRPKAPFIDGAGWTMDQFPNGLPDKKLIDAVISDRPVILKSASGHQLWVNSRALELTGINADTPDPEGGRIDRYPGTNEPSGSVQELSLIHISEPTRPY